jgi:hypothetical protein
MDENEQATLDKGMEESRDHYRHICSNTQVGFLNQLNEEYEEGFKLFGEIEKVEGLDPETGEHYIKRSAYLYNTEDTGLNSDEKSKRMQIIDAIDKAETYLYDRKTSLEGRENYLLLETNWDEVNSERKDLGLSKIGNEKQRTAYIKMDNDLRVLENEVQEATQWLKLVKKYAELHELPNGKAPWIVEEEKAQLKDEKASEVYVERVGAEPMAGDVDG